EEDDDVDMIPLIDISLVLLIFFMMTASVTSGIVSPIPTPPAKHQLAAISKDMYWVGIDTRDAKGNVEKGPNGKPLPSYSAGKDMVRLVEVQKDLTGLIQGTKEMLEKDNVAGEVRWRLRGHREFPIEVIKGVTLELQGLEQVMNRGRDPARKVTFVILGEVSE